MPRRLKNKSSETDLVADDLVVAKDSPYIVWKVNGFRHLYLFGRSAEFANLAPEVWPEGMGIAQEIELSPQRLRKVCAMEVIAMAAR